MITRITANSLKTIRNPVLAAYAERYLHIAQEFQTQVCQTGIQMAPAAADDGEAGRLRRLRELGAIFRNGDRSIVANRLSPACEACQTGVGSATFYVSLRCHRSCFYCFNPNQENYVYDRTHQRDPAGELAQLHAAGMKVHTLALTGGEPLLYKEEAYRFFRTATELFPEAHTRLYTSGDHADEATLQALQAAGLDEIRFSLHGLKPGQRHVFERMALARTYIPQVMVETPILPGSLDFMKEVLLELDRLEIHSINLLEFCFPFGNAEEFNRRGFTIKNPPYRVLYNYWYAGGLPVDGSEAVCLDLVAFALENGLKLGVHYCSLENKHTGQLYQQNAHEAPGKTAAFSENDYFIKSAKVFGSDMKPVLRAFRRQKFDHYTINQDYGFVEFPLNQIPSLRALPVEIGISSAVVEYRDGERFIRELKVDVTTPQQFDPAADR